MILLLGSDEALLEGLAQLLSISGRRVEVVQSLDEAEEIATRRGPLLLVVERGAFAGALGDRVAHLPLAPGGAIVVYRQTGAAELSAPMPRSLTRAMLAELELPLERNRLAALAASLESRAQKSGRLRRDTPPEHRI